jgi:membrane fusion protein (multidrug efflux system)
VTAAQARTEMSSKSVTDGVVRAPFAGLVAEKNVSPGEWVAPGRALFTLVDDVPLKIQLSVPEAAVRAMAMNQVVDIVAVSHPDQVFKAKVTRLGAEIDKSRALIVEATIEPGSNLVPGMFAEGHVVIGQTPRVVLPAEAVVKRGKTWHAFVDNKGELADRIVQLGPSPGPGQVSIVQGVVKGEKVVSKVTDAIIDGLKVVE